MTMEMESFTAVARNHKNGEFVLRFRADGKAQVLVIPATLLAKFMWAAWIEPSTPIGSTRESVTIPVGSIGTGSTTDGFLLRLQISDKWEIPLELGPQHLQPMRNILQQMETRFGGAGNA